MNWLLDTDVICKPAKQNGDARVIAWLEEEQDRCYTLASVVGAHRIGQLRNDPSVWAEQERLLDNAGQHMPIEDSYIAATARLG